MSCFTGNRTGQSLPSSFSFIADERGYDEILQGTVNVPRDTDVSGGEDGAHVKAANKRGYRDLILATKDTSLTMATNAKIETLPKGDLHMAWKKLEKMWGPKSREDKLTLLQNSFGSKGKASK